MTSNNTNPFIVIRGDSVQRHGFSRQYDGSKTGTDLRRWPIYSSNANDFIKLTYGELCNRNATLYHTSAIARACVNKPLMYEIGDGLFFKSMIPANFLNLDPEYTRDWSQRFSQLLHYDKLDVNYYTKQSLLSREAKITGDSLLYFLRDDDSSRPFDLLGVAGPDEINFRADGKNKILGVGVDEFNRRQSIYRTGNRKKIDFQDSDGNQNVIQMLYQERLTQLRGMGIFYSEIARIKGFDRMWDAIIERMVLESTQLGFFKTSYSDPAAQARHMAAQNKANGGVSSRDGSFSKITDSIDAPVGGMYQFQNEEGMEFTDLKSPSDNFGIANTETVNLFGMATNVPPEVIGSRYNSSYTAHKGALNDFSKKFLADRSRFAKTTDLVVNREYLKDYIRSGLIESPHPAFFTDYRIQQACLRGTWLGPVPGHVDPLREAKAEKLTVDEEFQLRGNVSAKYGNDYWDSHEEWLAQNIAFNSATPDEKEKQIRADLEARQGGTVLKEQVVKSARKATKKMWHGFSFGKKHNN